MNCTLLCTALLITYCWKRITLIELAHSKSAGPGEPSTRCCIKPNQHITYKLLLSATATPAAAQHLTRSKFADYERRGGRPINSLNYDTMQCDPLHFSSEPGPVFPCPSINLAIHLRVINERMAAAAAHPSSRTWEQQLISTSSTRALVKFDLCATTANQLQKRQRNDGEKSNYLLIRA